VSRGQGNASGAKALVCFKVFTYGLKAVPFRRMSFFAACSAVQPFARSVAFSKESRMKFANATHLNRKSGGALWRDLLFFGSHANSEGLISLSVYGTAEAVPRSLLTPEGSW
jgi:hypothetical protein